MIKVGVVAAARAMRIGLKEVLGALPDVEIVEEATRPQDIRKGEADVIVTASPFGMEGYEGEAAVLLLTDDPAEARELQGLGLPAWGAVPENASEDELKAALLAVAEGLWVIAPGLAGGLFEPKTATRLYNEEPDAQPLTERENEVLQLTAQGLANKQIAAQLGISEHTVKFHLSSLYAKLGVTSRTEAVRSGARRGLVVL